MQDIRLRKCLARPVWPGTLFQCNTGTAIIGAISNAGGAATITDIPEIGAYTRIYQLDIPDNAPYDTSAVPYGADNSGTPTAAGISRLAYYLE